MLNALRDGAKSGFLKFILLGFMALAVGGLVLTDVGGFFRGGVSNAYVAKGKGIEISTVEFDRTARRILSRQQITPQEAYSRGLINQILNSEVQTRIITREAQDLGLLVGDDTVRTQISKLAEPLAQNGTSKSEALRQILFAQGISEAEFINAIRQEMANGLFQNAVLESAANISNPQAEALYQFQNETLTFETAILNAEDVKDIESPTDMQLEKYYEANKSAFLIPERRSITIATLKKEMLEDKVNIIEDDLQAYYDDNIDTYKKLEQRKVQQAVLSSQDEASKVVEAIKNDNLEAAVQTVTGSKDAYLGENGFAESGLLEEVAGPVFSAEKGDVIGPIETSLGFHVLILKDIIAPQTTPFAKVKKSIKNNLLQEQLSDDLIDTANMLDDQLAGGAAFNEVVTELGLTTEIFEDINQAGFSKNNKDVLKNYQGDKARILEDAFDFNEGEASPVIELEDGRFITVHIDSVTPRSFQSYDNVKNDLRNKWIKEQKALSNRARAEDLLAMLEKGTSLDDATKELGLSVKTYKNLKKNEEPKKPLNFSYINQMFNADINTPLMIMTSEGFMVGLITERALPEIENKSKEIEDIQERLSENLSQELFNQYINSLAEKYKVKINDAVLREVYGMPQN